MDPVNHPDHYRLSSFNIEPITLGRGLLADYFNAFKYVCRAKYKGNYLEDLKKAQFYLKDAIYYYDPEWTNNENTEYMIFTVCKECDNDILKRAALKCEEPCEFWCMLLEEINKELEQYDETFKQSSGS